MFIILKQMTLGSWTGKPELFKSWLQIVPLLAALSTDTVTLDRSPDPRDGDVVLTELCYPCSICSRRSSDS